MGTEDSQFLALISHRLAHRNVVTILILLGFNLGTGTISKNCSILFTDSLQSNSRKISSCIHGHNNGSKGIKYVLRFQHAFF